MALRSGHVPPWPQRGHRQPQPRLGWGWAGLAPSHKETYRLLSPAMLGEVSQAGTRVCTSVADPHTLVSFPEGSGTLEHPVILTDGTLPTFWTSLGLRVGLCTSQVRDTWLCKPHTPMTPGSSHHEVPCVQRLPVSGGAQKTTVSLC